MVKILERENSILNTFVSELRNAKIQQDRMRFRGNLERIGAIMAYEISKTFSFRNRDVETPLGVANIAEFDETIVIGTILRAGLPMHHGMQKIFDRADSAIISAYRRPTGDRSFEIDVEYLSAPQLDGKILILCDPMLATGMSLLSAFKVLTNSRGMPKHTHIACVIGSEEGIQYVSHNIAGRYTIWAAAVDPEMNAKSYIVPGLGDAGDLSFGERS
jgi:uracil phosphoribosyltransferase